MRKVDKQEILIIFLGGLIVLAVMIKLYSVLQRRQRQALDLIYLAIDALTELDLSLRRYTNENPGSESNVIGNDIIKSASIYLPREDVEFLFAVHQKSADEIRQFINKRIHPEVFKMIETRDKLQLRVYGKTIP